MDAGSWGCQPESYHLLPGERLNEAVNRAWTTLPQRMAALTTNAATLRPKRRAPR
jgi:hypothetical protein